MIKDAIKFACFFLIVSFMLIGGNFHIFGPLSARHIAMLVLFLLYFISRSSGKVYRISPSHLKLYVCFLIVYALCNILNGEFLTGKFLQSFYTYHIPCIAMILGLQSMIKDKKDLDIMVKCIVSIFIINLLVSYLQFQNNSIAWVVASQISSSAEEGIEAAEMYNNAYGSIFGYSIVMGLFGFVVTNGYFIASYLPVATNSLQKNKINFVAGLCILLITIYIGYVVQQRMAFLMILLYIFYLITIRTKNTVNLLIVGIILLIVFLSQSSFFETLDMGRLTTNQNNDTRIGIYHDFWDYISSGDSFFGGQVAYHEKYHKYQHNTFTASYVAGGFFTFIVYCLLYFKLLQSSFKVMWQRRKDSLTSAYTISFALSSIFFLLYSITHTAGVHSGSPMFWLAYSLMFYAIEFENNKYNYNA